MKNEDSLKYFLFGMSVCQKKIAVSKRIGFVP
mgnify:CR=1 FL=1